MQGLGIVIEENEPEVGVVPPLGSRIGTQTPRTENTVDSENEVLLPPLPAEHDGFASSLIIDHRASLNSSVSRVSSELEDVDGRDWQFVDFVQNPTYELSSPSLKIDPLFSNLALQEPAGTENGGQSPLSHSPLKRLKNLKRGIRKLSLSKSNAVAAAVTSTGPKTGLNINTNVDHTDGFVSDSTADSLQSADRARPVVANISPLTTPSSSPIVSLSENLSTSTKNISELEQGFFASVSGSDKITSLEDMHKVDDLVKFLTFLNQLKVQTVDAFEVTRDRLVKFGWCSSYDLHNLEFQKDSSLLQIDTKLLQVEKRLNDDFNTSILSCSNGKVNKKSNSISSLSSSIDNISYSMESSRPSSLSLKNLESRCFSFPEL